MTLLIGFDDTPPGFDAVALGLQLAGETGDSVTVVTAYPDDEHGLMVAMNDRQWVNEVRQVAERKLDRAREAVADRPSVQFRPVGPSSASRALHELAERTEPHAIVVGSSEHGGLGRVSPGSTVERLLHGAPCPVAVAPNGYREHARPIRHIAVAYDGTAESRDGLDVAVRLGRALGARLQLVAVTRRADPALQSAVDDALGAVPEELRADGTVLVEDDVVGILAELPEPRPDLLVCGSRGYGPVRQILLGSVSTRVIRRAAYPVIVVPRTGVRSPSADAPTHPAQRTEEAS